MFCKVEKIQYLQSRGNTKFAKLRKYNTGIAEMRKNNICGKRWCINIGLWLIDT